MVEIEKYGSVKKFGPRYGRTLKEKFGKIEKEQRKKHKCPYCAAIKVKRVSLGIWQCGRCKAKFTGKAYSITRKITFKEEDKIKEAEPQEEKEVPQNG